MEGFLNKQGEKGLVVNLWRKRWFQLDPNSQRMYYYKTKSKEELLGYINLAEATEVVSSEPKDAFSFVIQTRDRSWNLSASSEVDKQAWMAAINTIIHRTAASIRPSAVQQIKQTETSSPSSNRSSEYLGIFEFEGEDGESQMPSGSLPEDTPAPDAKEFTFEMENSEEIDENEFPAPPAPTPMEDRSFLCGSLPVNVPRMASTWQSNPTWSMAEWSAGDDDGFVQPHEMAARTYKEISLQTGMDFNSRPRTHSKHMEAYM